MLKRYFPIGYVKCALLPVTLKLNENFSLLRLCAIHGNYVLLSYPVF